jgi:hypothetical protein
MGRCRSFRADLSCLLVEGHVRRSYDALGGECGVLRANDEAHLGGVRCEGWARCTASSASPSVEV